MMKAKGKIKIQDIELKDPTMEIQSVEFNEERKVVILHCLFMEKHYKHGRSFEFDNSDGKVKTLKQAKDLITKDKTLTKFKA